MTSLAPLIDSDDHFVRTCRDALLSGDYRVPLFLGLTNPVSHIERGQRDCYARALPAIAKSVGPAARVIDCGYFAGNNIGLILQALERPKAGIVLTATSDVRANDVSLRASLTAEVSLHPQNAYEAAWDLEVMAAGRTLVCVSGGGFGMLTPETAFRLLDNASAALATGDFVMITLEQPRDVALLEAAYLEPATHIINTALAKIGRCEGITARVFSEANAKLIRLGGIAESSASVTWNGTTCVLDAGTWIDFGAIHITAASTAAQLHPDFVVEDHWTSGDQIVSLLLLRKL